MAAEPLTEPVVVPDPTPEAPPAEPARSRRSILGAGLAGLAGLVLGSFRMPAQADAAVLNPLELGQANSAGTSNTSLTTASSGTALLVTQTGSGTALRGAATALNGVAGFFTSANGPGVSGVTANNTKYGVYGGNDALTYGGGAAIRASGEQNHGVVATTASTSAVAVKATNSAVGTIPGLGPAVLGLASQGAAADTHPNGELYRAAGEFSGPNGLIGAASSDTIGGTGVIGVAAGSAGAGVLGYATSSTGTTYGVQGQTDSTDGYGVFGIATAASGTNYSVYGYSNSSSGYALYGVGNGAVTGSFSKAGGSFKIDHPLDPANKFLYHSFVESPDMKNVYDGVATLDSKGEATVTLPAWFEALNRDFRYQLTAIGSFSPVYVKSKVHANAFSIAGGNSGQEISWQLTGIRQDAWANAHRIPVEEEKPAADRGLYLHPTEHGQAAAKGIDAVRNAAMKPHAGRGAA